MHVKAGQVFETFINERIGTELALERGQANKQVIGVPNLS
jgi:hypothetical protein